MEPDKQAIRQFLQRVHGSEPRGWLTIWTRQDRATAAFDLAEDGALEKAVEYCAHKAPAFDVYAAVGLQGTRPAGTSRGAEPGVSALPGFWADIDIVGPSHKAENLPPTEEDALSLINDAGLEPSIIVRSGFGLQPYWLFKEPWQIDDDDERQRLKSLSSRFQLNLRRCANLRGWMIDSTPDLCRLLRVPGTFNRKVDGDIRMVTAEYADPFYNLDDFEDLLAGIEDPGEGGREPSARPDLPPAKLPPILDGCAWMRHCRDDVATLPEPEWYRMLTVVARCEDSERWAHKLSAGYPTYSERETRQKLKQASGDKVAPVTCGYVQSSLNGGSFCSDCMFRHNINSPIRIGRMEGLDPAPEPELSVSEVPRVPEPQKNTQAAAMQAENHTDLGNAKRFVARYCGTVLYCGQWSRWLVWDGARWKEDQKLEVTALAGDLIRSLHPLAKKIKDENERKTFERHLAKSESRSSLDAMVALAKADRTVAKEPDQFDRDLCLFTVKNGTVDLRTGQLRPHDQKDMITKLAPISYDPAARCPNWLEFLDMIMLSRKSLIDFLKRAIGLSLTGITSDKAMFILYGPGGDNGKSTMVEVIEMLLGEYAMRTPVETFLKKREGSIPNDVARLRGARFVWAAENNRGAQMAESLIKEMTGGDRMAARFLYGEFFEFMPEFKIWLLTNHKPVIQGDQAIWRRLKLVPFDYTIPGDKQKKRHEVMAMFRSELPGILNWAIEGCLEWQRDGLGVPDEVINATREYEAEQNTFEMFLDERCVRVPNAQVLSADLYTVYRVWAEKCGETPASHKTFASLMSERGFAKSKTMKGALYSGVGLRTEDKNDQDGEV